jgi:ribonuclease G
VPLDAARGASGGPYLLARGPDPIVALARWAVARGTPRLRVDETAELRALTSAVPELATTARLWMDPQPLFEQAGIAAAIDEALAPEIRLAGGGRLVVDEAAALTSIDVDTAAAEGSSARATPLAVNLQAAEAIGRLIQLRELAGLIVIDFVPMRRPAERARVLHVLREALAGDDRTLRIGGWTRLGLFELSRERRGPSLLRRMTVPCGACGGAGRTRLPLHAAGDALRRVLAEVRQSAAAQPPALAVSPAVQAVLEGPLGAARAEVEQRLGMPLYIVARPGLPADGYCLQEGARTQ